MAMARVLVALLLLGVTALASSGAVRGQAFPALTCSPSQSSGPAEATPAQVGVDCVLGGLGAEGPGQTVTASVFGSPVNDALFVRCDSDQGLTCSLTPRTAAFVCPSPEGCSAGSPFSFTIRLSSDSAHQMFGGLSVLSTGPMDLAPGASSGAG